MKDSKLLPESRLTLLSAQQRLRGHVVFHLIIDIILEVPQQPRLELCRQPRRDIGFVAKVTMMTVLKERDFPPLLRETRFNGRIVRSRSRATERVTSLVTRLSNDFWLIPLSPSPPAGAAGPRVSSPMARTDAGRFDRMLGAVPSPSNISCALRSCWPTDSDLDWAFWSSSTVAPPRSPPPRPCATRSTRAETSSPAASARGLAASIPGSEWQYGRICEP
eukprot:CAMPEP_0180386460 /NCGR_PEP_ID=MMETSP0989-20121125/29668_1 /TAXON_ID=697907 /ORGANISM="non described non described, Strain CCMP2293" /LENGTH=219 /DNA_ID=CAMNT_0022387159 /DNA_START=581 /DNA_END=1241 /DNA_ORIENTATION=+